MTKKINIIKKPVQVEQIEDFMINEVLELRLLVQSNIDYKIYDKIVQPLQDRLYWGIKRQLKTDTYAKL